MINTLREKKITSSKTSFFNFVINFILETIRLINQNSLRDEKFIMFLTYHGLKFISQ